MRAAYINRHGGPECLEIGELPVPEISATEVLVRVKFSALNHLDLWVRQGLPSLKLRFPHVLGADASGTVEQIGSEVKHVKPGDEVIVHPGISCLRCQSCLTGWESLCRDYKILGEHVSGTNAEFVKVPGANVYSKPSTLSFEEAAAIPLVFTTAWQMAVNRAHVKPGDRVLIHAAGSGVSSAAIQIARLYGAEVIATSGSERKLERARALGASHTINVKTHDFVAEVKRIAKGGVDVILDHVGKDYWEKNFHCVKWGGTIVSCGATSGFDATTDLRHVFYRQVQILGSTMGSKGDFPAILRQVALGHLKGMPDKTFPLARIQEAHRYLASGEQFGKVLLAT